MARTVELTLLAWVLASVIGLTVAAFRVSPVPPLRVAGAAYVETVRNTPLTVLIVFFFFGLPKIGILYSGFVTAVIVLGGYTGAFLAETIRAGINSVGGGQAEAARSLGLTFPQVLRIVILPQALRTVVGPIGNLFIALTKNSSIAAAISVVELTETADRLNNETARAIPVFLGAAFCYLLITIPSGWGVGWLERRMAIKR